jgi:outer membrane protein assembly factor BamB
VPKPPGTLLWETAVPYGIAGLATADGLLCGIGDGVYAYRPATGRLAWHAGSRGTADEAANLPRAVIGTGGQLTVMNTYQPGIYGVDAGTGRTAWTFDVPYATGMLADGLAYADGRVYGFGWAGSGRGNKLIILALDSRTGRLEWRAALSSPADVAGFTAGGGAVYIASHNQDWTSNELIALDAATGRHLWTASGPTIPLAAGVAAGVVYGRTRGPDSPVAAADAATGAPLWNYPAFWASAASDSTMFVSTSSTVDLMTMNGDVVALDIRTGRPQWQRNFPQRVPTILATTSSVLYGAEQHGTLYALSARTGQELWRHSLPITGSQPDELLYLMATGSSVIAANVDQLYAVQA